MNFDNSSLDLPRKNSCESHVSVYYEQDQQKRPCAGPHTPCSCSNNEKGYDNPLVQIHDEDTTSIDLPPLIWHGYENPPKLLSVTNTGRTILINGHWTNIRPYIEGGPLNGTYLFSQIHFHCPSEHEINGKRYPLEMHIVHYKTSYLTQEKAMQEKDGTVVLAYLFQLKNNCDRVLSQITKLGPQLREVNSRTECTKIPLHKLITPFCSNYYIYWGSLTTKKNKYLLQWLINCDVLGVSRQEVEDLSNIITCAVGATVKRTPQLKPEFDAIYHVGEADYSLPSFKTTSTGDLCTICKNYEVSDVSCACKMEKLERVKTDGKVTPIVQLLYECQSKGQIGENNYREIAEKYICCKCRSVEISSCKKCEGQESVLPRKLCLSKQSKPRKRIKLSSDVEANGPDSGLMLKCKSKSLAYYRNIRNKEKKVRKKKRQKSRKSCDSESEKSSSKSSVSEDKSKDKLDSEVQSCESEAEQEVKKGKRFKDGKKPKSVEEHKVKKKKKKKEVEESGSNVSVKKGRSEPSVKAVNEFPRQKANSTVLISLSSKSSINDSEGSQKEKKKSCSSKSSDNNVLETEKKKKVEYAETPEVIITQMCEIIEKPLSVVLEYESENSIDAGKKKAKEKDSILKSSVGAQSATQWSKSRVNQQKTKDSESADIKNLAARKSKSKSPSSEILPKNKANMKRESDSSECSDSKVVMSNGSKSKIAKSKTVSEPAKSAQEVKCSITKSKLEIENLKCDITPPKDKKTRSSRFRKMSTEDAKGKNKADSEGQNSKQEYDITTIFEKKPDSKKAQPVAGDSDIPINFFLAPSTSIKSDPSYALTTSESDFIEEKKPSENRKNSRGLVSQEFTVNTATIPKTELPPNELKENPKGCLLMEHIFCREHKAKVSEWFSQEYRVTIMYDQYILQEYTGKFYPKELHLGDYEKLNLAPRYPEPESFNFRLQDCSIKKETKDQICVRVKFLLKDLSVLPIFENRENKPNETSEKKEKLLFDQQTQCSLKELNLVANFVSKVLKANKNTQISDPRSSEILMNKYPKLENEEKEKQQSKREEEQKVQSKSEERERSHSRSGERQRPQSRSAERERPQSRRAERERPQSKNEEEQQRQPKNQERQRQQSKSGERQRPQSKNEEEQQRQPKNQERQRQQSKSGEKQRPQSKNEEEQQRQTKNQERQRQQSKSGERQRQQSKSAEREMAQPKNEDEEGRQSKNEERQSEQSKSEEKQKRQLKNKSIHWENETAEPQKYTNKLQNDSDAYSQDTSQSSVTEAFSTDSNLKEDKIEPERSEKKMKSLFVKRRKTVYFIYDKVEKDEGTGKKVFVGSFKTKEELDDMKKPKTLPQENGNISASEKSEENSEAKCFVSFENKKADLKVTKLQESPAPKSDPPSKNSRSTSLDTSYKNKDLVTLHKYKPRYSETNRWKRDYKNVSPTKVAVNPQRNTESSKHPISVSKGKAPKASSKEVYEPSESDLQNANPDCDDGKTEKKIKAKNVVPIKSQDNFSQTEVEDLEKSSKAEEDSAADNSPKSMDKKESQAALILIPVVAENLSKTEMILIEELNKFKKDQKKDKNNV